MGTLRQACTNLAELTATVSGVAESYDVGGAPADLLNDVTLPALIIAPAREAGAGGFKAEAFGAGCRTVNYVVEHWLVVESITNQPMGHGPPAIVCDLMDEYVELFSDRLHLDLDDELQENLKFTTGLEVRDWGGKLHWVIVFTHQWEILVAGQED